VGAAFSDLGEMALDDYFHLVVDGDPRIVVLEAMDEVFHPSMVDAKMKEANVRIFFLKVGNSRALPFTFSFKHGHPHCLPFKPSSIITFLNT
jgi:hypothetical protein